MPSPVSGVRRTASSMFPASLRAGMTTEQRYCGRDAGCGFGRAISVTVRQKCGSNGASRFALSPLATLERGYAIVSLEGGAILRDASAAAPGTSLAGLIETEPGIGYRIADGGD